MSRRFSKRIALGVWAIGLSITLLLGAVLALASASYYALMIRWDFCYHNLFC